MSGTSWPSGRTNVRSEAQGLPEEESFPWKHGVATLAAFVAAGIVPLIPYLLPLADGSQGLWSTALTFSAQFGLGVLRALITREPWWKSGLETLALGAIVAVAAYSAGALVAWVAE